MGSAASMEMEVFFLREAKGFSMVPAACGLLSWQWGAVRFLLEKSPCGIGASSRLLIPM